MKFWQIIDRSFLGKFIEKKADIIDSTDPQRIYVENIRRFFNIPFKIARLLCEMAVKEGHFKKKVGIYCPDCGRQITAANNKSEIPDNIKCDTCELLEKDKFEFTSKEFRTMEFYQLNEQSNGN